MEDQKVNSSVLLIGEYDAALTACLNDSSLFNRVRNYLAHFYSLIKAGEGIFRFVFITGITRFNRISIFSEMNNFSDISLEIKYGSLLGYTEQEVKKYFGAYLSNAARVLDTDPEILFAKLKNTTMVFVLSVRLNNLFLSLGLYSSFLLLRRMD